MTIGLIAGGRSWVAATFAGAIVAVVAHAQTAPGPSPGRMAIDSRKAAYTLIGANFRPLGAILKGAAPYDAAEVEKRANRLAFLAAMLDENFPDASNLGAPDTKAKGEIWANRADFDAKLRSFQTDVAALVQAGAPEQGSADAAKAAIAAIGQDCKACHDKYRDQ